MGYMVTTPRSIDVELPTERQRHVIHGYQPRTDICLIVDCCVVDPVRGVGSHPMVVGGAVAMFSPLPHKRPYAMVAYVVNCVTHCVVRIRTSPARGADPNVFGMANDCCGVRKREAGGTRVAATRRDCAQGGTAAVL